MVTAEEVFATEGEEGGFVLELLGQTVKRTRMEMALTQRDLARRSGLDVSSISYLERGVRRARISTIHQLAEALGCEPLKISRIVNVKPSELVESGDTET